MQHDIFIDTGSHTIVQKCCSVMSANVLVSVDLMPDEESWQQHLDTVNPPPDLSQTVTRKKEREYAVERVRRLTCFAQVHEWMLQALPLMEIVNRIKDLGDARGIADTTLRNYLNYYRLTIPKSLILDRTFKAEDYMPDKRRAREALLSAAKALTEFSFQLGKMNEIIEMQHKRIKLVYDKEMKMEFLMGGTHKEIRLQADLIEKAMDLKDRMSGNGELMNFASQPEAVANLDKIYAKDGLNEMIQSNESRMKVLNTVTRLLTTYAKADEAPVRGVGDEIVMKEEVVAPITPNDEGWTEAKVEEVYKAPDAPTLVQNPFVDPNFKVEDYSKITRRAPG